MCFMFQEKPQKAGMGPMTMKETKKQLRAVLLSRKGGVALDQLEIEYFNLVCNMIIYPTFSLKIF